MAKEDRSWGYDRIVGRSPTWDIMCPIKPSAMFSAVMAYRQHRSAGGRRPGLNPFGLTLRFLPAPDFFTVEVLSSRGMLTYYVLFFIHLESRRVDIAGVTDHPNDQWIKQMARNATMEGYGALLHCPYLLHDSDAKYSAAFKAIIKTGHVKAYLYCLEVQT